MRRSRGRSRSASTPGISCRVSSTRLTGVAERIEHARHLESDDAAADDQHRAGELRQFERIRGIDDARVLRQPGQPHRFRARGDDALLEADALDAGGALDLEHVGATKRPTPRTTSTLRCFASTVSPPVSFATTEAFQSRSRARSILGSPKAIPRVAISSASSMTLAACNSALEGMQPTFRHTPPSSA